MGYFKDNELKLNYKDINITAENPLASHLVRFVLQNKDNFPKTVLQLISTLLGYCSKHMALKYPLEVCQKDAGDLLFNSDDSLPDSDSDNLKDIGYNSHFKLVTEKKNSTSNDTDHRNTDILEKILSSNCHIYTDITEDEYNTLRSSFPSVAVKSSYSSEHTNSSINPKFLYFLGIDIIADSVFSILFNEMNIVNLPLYDEEFCISTQTHNDYIANDAKYSRFLEKHRRSGKQIYNIYKQQVRYNHTPMKAIFKLLPADVYPQIFEWKRMTGTKSDSFTTFYTLNTNACYGPLLKSLCNILQNTPWNAVDNIKVASVSPKRSFYERYTQKRLMEYVTNADNIKSEDLIWRSHELTFLNHYLFEKIAGLHSTLSIYDTLLLIPDNRARAYFAYTATDYLSKMPATYGRSHILRDCCEHTAYSVNDSARIVLSPEKINTLINKLTLFDKQVYHCYRQIFYYIYTELCKAAKIPKRTMSDALIFYLSALVKHLKIDPLQYTQDLYESDNRHFRLNKNNPYRKTFCNISKLMIEAIGKNTTESIPESLKQNGVIIFP